MKAGDTAIFNDKMGRQIIIIIPDAWPTLPIEAFYNGITVGSLSFEQKDSNLFISDIYINENYQSSGLGKELVKIASSLSSSLKFSDKLINYPKK